MYIETDLSSEVAQILSTYQRNRVQEETPEEEVQRHKSPPQGDRVTISQEARALAAAEKDAEAETLRREAEDQLEADDAFREQLFGEGREAEMLEDEPTDMERLPDRARGFGKIGQYF